MPIYPLPFSYFEADEQEFNDGKKDKDLGKLLSPFSYKVIKEAKKDKNIRKQILRDSIVIEDINGVEKCIADKSRIISDEVKNIYRQRFYDVGDTGNGFCFVRDLGLQEYVYYNSSIPHIYQLKHLEYINAYREERILSFLKLIYPAKMPTKDYFPFIEFDIGTKIPLVLTEKEKERYNEYNETSLPPNIYEYEIKHDDWCYCIIWLDEHSMFMNLEDNAYYFKQIGKNVHLFDLVIPL